MISPEIGEILYQQAEGMLSESDRMVLEEFDQTLSDLGDSAGEVRGEKLDALVEQAFQMVPGSREAVIRRDSLFDMLMLAEKQGRSLPQ